MEELMRMKCVACRKDAPKVTEQEIAAFLPQVLEWNIVVIPSRSLYQSE